MRKPPVSIKLTVAVAGACVAAVLTAGCGTDDVDRETGRSLFIQRCGQCHALAEAATTGDQGPNLDKAFAAARATGMDSDTIEGVVQNMIQYPRESSENPAVSMPADVVKGEDVNDVAAYVADVAGVPGIGPPKVPGGPGAQVFANNGCGGCHTLKAANAGGTTGPDLDEVLAGQSAAMIDESIIEPNKEITQGFPANVMPQDYSELIPPEDLKLLVDYLVKSSAGGAKK